MPLFCLWLSCQPLAPCNSVTWVPMENRGSLFSLSKPFRCYGHYWLRHLMGKMAGIGVGSDPVHCIRSLSVCFWCNGTSCSSKYMQSWCTVRSFCEKGLKMDWAVAILLPIWISYQLATRIDIWFSQRQRESEHTQQTSHLAPTFQRPLLPTKTSSHDEPLQLERSELTLKKHQCRQ